MNMEQLEKDMLRKANETRRKELEKAAKQITLLARAAGIIMAIAQDIAEAHKYDMFPIQAANEEQPQDIA